MSIRLKLKNSVVQDSTPSASDLPEVGELAVNGNINSIGGFMRASDSSIVKIFGPGSVTTPTATTTVSGISELATNSETTTGTATNRVVTPAGLNAVTTAERTTSNNNYVAKAGSTLTGVLTMPNGSNSAPAINFGDSDSGIFGGTNTVSLAAGGTTRLTADTGVSVTGALAVTGAITSTSDLTIADKIIHAGDTNTAVRFPVDDTVSVETGGSEALRVDSSGRLIVGAPAARSNLFNTTGTHFPRLQVESANNNDGRAALALTYGIASALGPYITLSKHRSNVVGANGIVLEDDEIGLLSFQGNDGAEFVECARIVANIDGTPGSNDMPGRLVFSTTADGAASPTERLRIDSTGLSTFSGNVSFGDNNITNVGTIALDTIKGDADDNTNINFAGNDIVNIKPAGTTRLSVNTTGVVVTGTITGSGDMTIDTNTLHVDSTNNRVGIGTTSPTYPTELTVSDTTAYSVSTTNSTQHQLRINNAGLGGVAGILLTAEPSSGSAGHAGIRVISPSSGNAEMTFSVRDGGTYSEKLRIDSSGRVLIGTTTEGHASADNLTINDSGNGGITIRTGTASNGAIFFSDATSGTDEYDGFVQYNHGTDPFMQFGVGGGTKMAIKGSNLGIGTTSPATLLHLKSNSADCDLQVESTGSGTDARLNLYGRSDGVSQIRFGDEDDTNVGLITYDHTSNYMLFRTADAERMRIDSSGRVGIGTSSPTVTLDIESDTPVIKFTDANATGTPETEVSGAGGNLTLSADKDNEKDDTAIICQVDGSTVISVTSNDQVEFEVGSTAKFQRHTGGTNTNAVLFNSAGSLVGKIFFNNSSTAYITEGSDRTLKKNFENWTESVLPLFKNLTPQKFNFTQEEDSETKHKGFIAQDEVASFPEAYPKDPNTDKYLYSPNNMVVYLMKAIQELEAKVAALEAA